jgi:hypothetical protein
MLCQVHGHRQLHLPQAQDTQARWGHHYGDQDSVSTGLRVEQHRVSHLHDRRDQAKGSEPLSTISFDQPIHAPLVQCLQSD